MTRTTTTTPAGRISRRGGGLGTGGSGSGGSSPLAPYNAVEHEQVLVSLVHVKTLLLVVIALLLWIAIRL